MQTTPWVNSRQLTGLVEMCGLGGPTVRECIKVKSQPACAYEFNPAIPPFISKESAGPCATTQVGCFGAGSQTSLRSRFFNRVIPFSFWPDFILIVVLMFGAELGFASQSQLTMAVSIARMSQEQHSPWLREAWALQSRRDATLRWYKRSGRPL